MDIVLETQRIPLTLWSKEWLVELRSPILLEGQKMLMPTVTPSTMLGEETRLMWNTDCQHEGNAVALGEEIDTGVGICRCDVDNTMRHFDGRPCFD